MSRLTATTALDRLRRMGRPPSGVDINKPSREAQNALFCIGVLSGQKFRGSLNNTTTTIQIRANWAPVLERWVLFFLKSVILASEEPITPEGVDFVDNAFAYIPELVSFPDLDYRSIRHSQIEHLIVQAWLKVIEKDHGPWGPWSLAAASVTATHSDTLDRGFPNTTPPVSYHVNNAQLGLILIRKLNTLILRLPQMGAVDINHFRTYLSFIIGSDSWVSGPRPIFIDTNLLVLSLLSIIRTLLLKRRITPGVNEKTVAKLDAEVVVHYTVRKSLALLITITDNPFHVLDLLDSGFIDAIFKCSSLYYALDEKDWQPGPASMSQSLTKILDRLSRYLVFGTVLRQFIRKTSRVRTSPNLEERLKSRSQDVWRAWDRVRNKALALYEFYCNIKRIGFCLCPECPTRLNRPQGAPNDNRVGALYCSAACQKRHWNLGHGEDCRRYRGPDVIALEQDFLFIQEWAKSCLSKNASFLSKGIADYMSEALEDSGTENHKSPIIFIDLDSEGLPSEEAFQIINTDDITELQPKYKWNPETIDEFLRDWQAYEGQQDSITMLISIPKYYPQAMIIWASMSYPLEGDNGMVQGGDGVMKSQKAFEFLEGDGDILD
ncbi:hypothetical protein V5O48_006052 [Marasmius crinis-equi]|uniref:MYND-type domain-containing protein n=1 Tax=Marasmius crinis-equi TaxID=585013 RepID=A0ABR3FKL5_9AGAR